jgi:hypothetical protein
VTSGVEKRAVMDRNDLKELHYIAPIENVPSIVKHGILSNRRAALLPHSSVAMPEIQDRRAGVVVPGGRRLHEYVNLYICARNPMLFKRKGMCNLLCVLAVDPGVLDLPGVVITDGNAAGDYVRFAPSPEGLAIVNRDRTFAEYWTDEDQIEYFRKKAAKCAEVLVPDRIDSRFLRGVYVVSMEAETRLDSFGTGLMVYIDSHMFFGTEGTP